MLTVRESIREMTDRLAARGDQYARAASLQARVLRGEETDTQPLLLSAQLDLSRYPDFSPKETHYDPEKMLCQQLRAALCAAEGGREAVPSVRPNMGCGIVHALFGLTQQLFDDKMPWLQEHLDRDRIMALEPGDLTVTPEFQMALTHIEYMADALKGTGVLVYPVDIQGAIDTAHLLMGDDMFYELYDDEEYMDHAIALSEAAIILAMDECMKRIPASDTTVSHYSAFALPRDKGAIKLSEDTTTLISREHIRRYAAPALHRLLSHYGGGYVHFCGKNGHLFDAVLDEPLCLGVNFGNPDMQDMDEALRRLASSRKCLMGPASVKTEIAKPYFSKVLRNSYSDGRFWCLLQYSCAPDQVEAVSRLWDDAAASHRDRVK